MFNSKQIIILLFVFNLIQCYRYSLPGDQSWPKITQFQNLKTQIKGKVLLKGEQNYNPHTWNGFRATPKPAVIVYPANSQDVIVALQFAQTYNIKVSVQSTGHHQEQRNIQDNSVHLDMNSLNSIQINLTQKTLTLGPGNNFSRIQQYVAQQSNETLVALCGGDPGVGIYGWTVGGGHGPLTRFYGLGVDALLSVDIVLANLTVVTASKTQNKDLFRALRGSGGGAFGIVISLTVKLYDNPGKVSIFHGIYNLSSLTAQTFGNWFANASSNTFAYYFPVNTDPSVQPYLNLVGVCYGNDCGNTFTQLNTGCIKIPQIPQVCVPQINAFSSFYQLFKYSNSQYSGNSYLISTVLNQTNIVAALQEVNRIISAYQGLGCSGNAILGGASAVLDPYWNETAVAPDMRTGIMALTCYADSSSQQSPELKTLIVQLMTNISEQVFKKYNKWVYWNEPNHVFTNNDWRERYWGGLENYNRLLKVKQQIDPQNFFTCYHCIGYDETQDIQPAVCPQTNCSCSNNPTGGCSQVQGNLASILKSKIKQSLDIQLNKIEKI